MSRTGLITTAIALGALVVSIATSGVREPAPPVDRDVSSPAATSEPSARGSLEERWNEMEAAEGEIRALGSMFRSLGKAVLNLRLPDVETRAFFAERVEHWGIVDELPERPASVQSSLGTRRMRWEAANDKRTAARDDLALWTSLFDEVDYFDRAGFHIDEGRFLEHDRDRFEIVASLDGMAKLHSGETSWVRSLVRVRLRRPDGDAEWRIEGWKTDWLERVDAEGTLFEEVLDEALPDRRALERARRSLHEELLVRAKEDPSVLESHEHFTPIAIDRHPGLSVVDLDRDGFDDIYLMARWGKNQFFHNRGDGTFVERAASLGLDVDGHTSSALFADFDNDGDVDVLLGRTLRRSMYLRNEGGRFVDRSDEQGPGTLPFLVSSLAAADYDRDGLLDVYVSTYAQAMVVQDYFSGRGRAGSVLHEFLDDEDVASLYAELEAGRAKTRDLAGPPNVLLRNVGGRFVQAEADNVRAFANTYHSTWADYDNDGDSDLYLANDYGDNQLFRNEGEGDFTDVARQTQTTDVGFGMGASFGDFDLDGDQDLYVTNMYSFAGKRVTSYFPELPEYQKMSSGNSLLRNDGEVFAHISGTDPSTMRVEQAGWSWSGQFVDVDNDMYLDIAALSGQFSAPPEFSTPVDT